MVRTKIVNTTTTTFDLQKSLCEIAADAVFLALTLAIL